MIFLGFTFVGPHRYCFYQWINPWYTRILMRMFSITDKMLIRKTFVRVMMDVFGYLWIYSFMNLYYTGLVKFRSFSIAWSEMKRQFGAASLLNQLYYGTQLTLFYLFVPRYLRAIISTSFSIIWAALYSWISFNV